MGLTVTYSPLARMAVMMNPLSDHEALQGGLNELLISCVCGSSNSSTPMTLDLSADISGVIYGFAICEITGKTGTVPTHMVYSSASGSASTGGILIWSTLNSTGDTGYNTCLSKKGQTHASDKFRARVLYKDA